MKDIISFFNEHGLYPNDIQLDGKIHRFSADKDDQKKSGWYVGFQNHTLKSGETFEVVTFGNYREGVTFTYQSDKVTLTREDKSHIKKQVEAAKRQAEEEREKLQNSVALETQATWKTLNESGTHEYLVKKQIVGCEGLGVRFDGRGDLFIPMRDINGKLWSFQRITWDGQKRYKFGGKVSGCFHSLGVVDDSDIIRVAEGFATGVSIHIATGEYVAIAFQSNNLVAVVTELKKKYPDKLIVVCGDEDKFKTNAKNEIPNPGRVKAEEAAKVSLGKAVFPKFKNEETKPTDFNDLHCLEGIETLRAQLKEVKVERLALYSLGFKEKEYFFTSTENRQVVGVTAFSEKDLLDLMPISYWETVFPGRTDTSRVDWTAAKSQLMQTCRRKGLFRGHNVRGAGVWLDDGRIVVNMGDHLIVDGMKCDLGAITSRYFYTLGESMKKLHPNPLKVHECKILTEVCQKFKWTRGDSGILLAGILVLSRVSGALPVRPHCWITGGAQTGKSTLLEHLIRKIIGMNSLYVQGGTTEAGVRQSVKSNAVPVLFDEFEINGGKGDANIAALIELMRASWSDSSAHIVKGGATGNASHFQVRFSAIVSSIRTKLINDADKGRFTVIELAPHGSDMDHWKDLSQLLVEIDDEFADRLFARVVRLIPVMLENFKLLKKSMSRKADSRFGDQYGMILAGYSILVQSTPITQEDADFICENIELDEEKQVSKQADHDDAMSHLLSTAITYEAALGRKTLTIGAMIQTLFKYQDTGMKEALLNLGIKVESDHVAIVTPNHAALESAVWRGTKWSQSWGIILRVPKAERKKQRIDGMPRWAINIPADYFLSQSDL